ncbi:MULTISPECIES: hypothetical protein [Methylobacterium]|jgi:hypothetical protein|uniref:hypothetical protein n=1 Tax=Methylobacterium TaxID=407 RepID=UPI00164FCBDF|nr:MULTISPECIES: hypothetical protein [Methylobacterium]GJE22506.1 hypothetical protein JHFBIEKO_2961 [Methylobacterium mesophilicum]
MHSERAPLGVLIAVAAAQIDVWGSVSFTSIVATRIATGHPDDRTRARGRWPGRLGR